MRKSNGVWAWCELQQRFTRALQRCRHGAGSNANMAGQWLSNNPSKRWTEVFMLAYSPCWILWALCVFVPLQLYEVGPVATSACLCWVRSCLQVLYHERVRSRCGCHVQLLQHCYEWGYTLVGLAAALPCILLPLMLECKVRADAVAAASQGPSSCILQCSCAHAPALCYQSALQGVTITPMLMIWPFMCCTCRQIRASLCISDIGSR